MDPIQWVAAYSDGTSLKQYNADGTENRYPSIDRSKLESFAIQKDGHVLLRYHFDHPDQRLIYRRRVFMLAGQPQPVVFYLVGWQRKVSLGQESINLQSISVLGFLNDGSHTVEVIGRWGSHPLFEAVDHLDCEKEELPLLTEVSHGLAP
jgi:hypothetical protein